MKLYTSEQIAAALAAHGKWTRGEADGTRANLRGADLTRADLTRANLRDADLTDADLTDADLTDADLTRADLTRANLRDANLRDADLTDADLTRADLRGANLRGADLTRADLRDAEIPVVPALHRKMIEAIEAGGHLDMSDWHTCETTHCRAGWAVTLAGEPGAALEKRLGPSAAGALITVASAPYLEGRVPNFYASNEEAMKDIRACAERETAA